MEKAPNEQVEKAQAALRLKQENAPDRPYLDRQEKTADTGAITAPNPDAPVSGAFDAEGHRPVLERSRKVR
jgi:hypothetical protein